MGDRPATRRLWVLAEHVHAAVYFAPEARAAYEPLGLNGFWRGYFAGRAARMGAVGSGTVEATCSGSHPDFVARRVPEVWETASPAAVLAARSSGVSAALAALLGDVAVERIEDAADRLVDAMA